MLTGVDWLRRVADASASLEKANDFIVGGPLTETLVGVGDAFVESAIDHLSQARHSAVPRERSLQAAASLQDAYYLYNGSARRGPSQSLRAMFDLARLKETHLKAAGCAASVALVQWSLGESEHNRRAWLDRSLQHLRAADEAAVRYVNVWHVGWFRSAHVIRWYIERRTRDTYDALEAYFRLEAQIVPRRLVRPRPLGWRPSGEARAILSFTGSDLELTDEVVARHRWE